MKMSCDANNRKVYNTLFAPALKTTKHLNRSRKVFVFLQMINNVETISLNHLKILAPPLDPNNAF
jgi:hypothetical protein